MLGVGLLLAASVSLALILETVIPVPKFNHGSTGFSLNGPHADVLCSNCHRGGGYTSAAPACLGCHAELASFGIE